MTVYRHPAFADAEAEFDQDDAKPDGSAGPIGTTEDELAREFSRRHGADWRYVAAWSAWMRWDAQHWQREPTLEVFDLARAVCRDAAATISSRSKKLRAIVLSARTRAAVENLARSDRAHAATSEQWDADPIIITGGSRMTINLRTGEYYAPRREDYITKIAGTWRNPDMPIPLWTSFLGRVTADNKELQDYLQRLAGYCLTGDTKEHVLFFLYGTGANGKSVFINTLLGIWKDYALSIGSELLMTCPTERHPTEIARLRGVRLAVASEIEIGRTWAEAKIKALTGGDRLQGRFMRQDFFEFTPQFKLAIVGNHKPSLRGVDEAIRRRLHLVPFTVTIPAEDRDPDLQDNLKAEWPGILHWAVQGCLDWQQQGLEPPACVTSATDAYLASEDSFALWRDECTEDDPNAWERSTELWGSWKAWAERSGEFVGSKKRFVQILEERRFTPQRQPGTGRYGYLGARIIRSYNYTEDPRVGS